MTSHAIESRERPFQTIKDSELQLENPFHGKILGRLLSTVQNGDRLAVLMGEPGTGKTTVLRRLMAQSERRGWNSVIHRVPVGVEDLRATLSALGHGRRAVVGLDEAQALPDELLTALPALLAEHPTVEIVLVGEPPLAQRLDMLEASGVRLPISTRCWLTPFDAAEVGLYIEYCWHRTEIGRSPFSGSAVRRITHVSGGIPQVVNSICDRALHVAAARSLQTVSAELVDEIASGLILKAPPTPFLRFLRRLNLRSVAGGAAIAGAVAILFLVAGVAVWRHPAKPGGEAPTGKPPAVATAPASIESPGARTESPPVTHGEMAAPTPPARKAGRALSPLIATARPLPSRGPSRGPLAVTRREVTGAQLLQSAEDGDLQAVRGLLADGSPPDARDLSGLTPLMLAVIHDHRAITEFLIAKGATVNVQSRAGLTPLMLAAINNRPIATRTLLDQGANPNVRTAAGWTALMYAAWRGHPEIVRLLLARGADAWQIDREGWTALDYARWRAVQPASPDDPSMTMASAEAEAITSGIDHPAVIALLQRAGPRGVHR